MEGAIGWLLDCLAYGFEVWVHSEQRSRRLLGRRAMRRWLRYWGAQHFERQAGAGWFEAGYVGALVPETKARAAGRWLVQQLRWPRRLKPEALGLALCQVSTADGLPRPERLMTKDAAATPRAATGGGAPRAMAGDL